MAVAAGLREIKGNMVGRARVIHLMAGIAIRDIRQEIVVEERSRKGTGIVAVAAGAREVHSS